MLRLSTCVTKQLEATVNSEAPRGAVLVVEDEPPIRVLLEDGLTTEGYEVRTAADAGEAIRTLEDGAADVVLVDLMLPGTSGLQLARLIRERWPIFIIVMSASSRLLDRAREDPCVDRALAKPFDWDALMSDLREGVSAA